FRSLLAHTAFSKANSGRFSARNKASCSAALARARIKREADEFALDENSQRAVGYDGLSVTSRRSQFRHHLFSSISMRGENMTGKLGPCKSLGFLLLLSVSVIGQERKPPVTIVFAVLQNTLDTKTAAVGDEVTLITLNDVVSDNQIVIPKGSRLLAHVAGVVARSKDERKSVLAIAVDKASGVSGHEIPLQAIIAAIGAPRN